MERKLKNPKGKGIRFEREVRKYFEEMGWFCIRQASSAFPDLIAITAEEVLAIECKTNGKLSKTERKSLEKLWAKYGMFPLLAHKKAGPLQLVPIIEPAYPKKQEKKQVIGYIG